jgi:opacity protein-like surface antigen
MKKIFVTIIVVLFTFLASMVQAADNAQSSGQLGLYIGAKISLSNVRMEKRKFEMNTGEVDDGSGGIFAAEHQILGMGSGSNNVFGGGLTFGFDFDKHWNIPLRIELDYTIRGESSSSNTKSNRWYFTWDSNPMLDDNTIYLETSVKLQTLMFNFWYDIPTGTALKPYIGGGVGLAFIKYSSQSYIVGSSEDPVLTIYGKRKTNFAWSLGAGLGYEISPNITLDLGYRYINAGSVTALLENSVDFPYHSGVGRISSHDVILGIRYTF